MPCSFTCDILCSQPRHRGDFFPIFYLSFQWRGLGIVGIVRHLHRLIIPTPVRTWGSLLYHPAKAPLSHAPNRDNTQEPEPELEGTSLISNYFNAQPFNPLCNVYASIFS